MTVGLDTSVVVRLLSGAPEDLAEVALRCLRERREAGDRVLVSQWVLAETYYAFQHHYGVSKKATLDALRAFLETPGVEGLGEVAEVLAIPKLESARPGFVDRLIHRHYLRSGAEHLVTFERAAARLSGAVVLAS